MFKMLDLFYSFLYGYTSNDFIAELTSYGFECYLTGNALTSLIIKDKKKIKDRDIYIHKMNIFKVYSILQKYGDIYTYGGNDIKKMRLILHPYNSDIKYEFTNNSDYGATINSAKYSIQCLNDINIFNIGKIGENDIFKIYDIKNKKWKNYNECEYFYELENIMRCFALSSEFDLTINEKTLSNIKKQINNGFIKFNTTVIFNELYKICSFNKSEKYLKYMYDFGIFKLLNMNYSNFDNVLSKIVFDVSIDEKFKILLGYNEIHDIEKWASKAYLYNTSKLSNTYREFIYIIKYHEQFKKIHTKYDMLTFINMLNNINYYNKSIDYIYMENEILPSFERYHYIMYHENLNMNKYHSLLNECCNYPFSIDELEIDGFEIMELGITKYNINETKEKLLYYVFNDSINNLNESLIHFIKTHDELFIKNITTE